jgi:hypothetical protein
MKAHLDESAEFQAGVFVVLRTLTQLVDTWKTEQH